VYAAVYRLFSQHHYHRGRHRPASLRGPFQPPQMHSRLLPTHSHSAAPTLGNNCAYCVLSCHSPFPLTFWATRWLYLPTKLCTPPASRNFALRAFAVPPIARLSNVAVVSVARTRAAFVSRRGASYIVGDEYSTEWSGCGRLQGPQFIIRAFLSHLRNFLTNLPASAPQFVFISLDSGSYQSPHLTPALLGPRHRSCSTPNGSLWRFFVW
jgi:hypothetical protein